MKKKEIEKISKNIVTIKNSSRTQHTKIKQGLQDLFTWLQNLNEKLEKLSDLFDHCPDEPNPKDLVVDFLGKEVAAEDEPEPKPEPKSTGKISDATLKALGKNKKK